MSATYQGKHGTNMSRMQQYLVTNSGSGTSPSSINGSTGTTGVNSGSIHEDDEREKNEQESENHELEKMLENAKKELEHEDD